MLQCRRENNDKQVQIAADAQCSDGTVTKNADQQMVVHKADAEKNTEIVKKFTVASQLLTHCADLSSQEFL